MAITFLNVKFISCFVIHTPQLHIDIDFSFTHKYTRNRNREIKTKHTSKRTHTVNYATVCIQFNIVQCCWIRRISFKMSKNDLFICEIPSHNVFLFVAVLFSVLYIFFFNRILFLLLLQLFVMYFIRQFDLPSVTIWTTKNVIEKRSTNSMQKNVYRPNAKKKLNFASSAVTAKVPLS